MFSYSVTIHQRHLQPLAILLLSTNVTYNRLAILLLSTNVTWCLAILLLKPMCW